ncbi:MAG: NAD+ synthase [Campylobacteraceae bacterium]|nr:NAD+ synthase [Campylobacteraceae bacterium]
MSQKQAEIETFLVNFLREEVGKIGFSKVVLGLSGGIDSAVVALLAKRAFGKNMLCMIMPSSTSNPQSLKDAKALCKKHELPYEVMPIGHLVESYNSASSMSELRKGNFTSRIRMSVLYDISARENALVLGASNKSELLLGYGTLHGDLASAFNPIGDIYKSDIFDFARHLGVNEEIVSKAPSADLWEGQSDEKELGFPYSKIDAFLKAFIENGLTLEELEKKGFESALCKNISERVKRNAFKTKPPTIAKLKII